jgi:hypothetical protein
MLRPSLICGNWQGKPEDATLSERTFDANAASVSLNNLTAQVQTQTASPTPTSSLNEAVEELFLLLWRNSATAIAHGKLHLSFPNRRYLQEDFFVWLTHSHSVIKQVLQNPLNLYLITVDGRQ